MTEPMRIEDRESIRCITWTRLEKRNAITVAMYAAMSDALDTAAADAAIRVVLITGSGGCFTSGTDISEVRGRAPGAKLGEGRRFVQTLAHFPKPVVCAVNGLAVGMGVTMLPLCDINLAAAEARFRMPFVDLGLVPELGSSLLLPRLAGYHRAAELMFLAEEFEAAEAAQIGLVNRVVPRGALDAAAMALAARLAAKPPGALAATKALLRGDLALLDAQIDRESAQFWERMASEEVQGLMAAAAARRSGKA